MSTSTRTSTYTGALLLLLAAGIIISMVAGAMVTSVDPFERAKVAELLNDVHDNKGASIVSLAAGIAISGFIGVAAAAAAYALFRERGRAKALTFFGLILAGNAMMLASNAAGAVLIYLSDDFHGGGPGDIAANSDVVLEVGRAFAMLATVLFQGGFATIGAAFLPLGWLLSRGPETGVVPPRLFGWAGVLAGIAAILSWTIVFSDVGFVFMAVSGISQLVLLIGLGLWLLVTPVERQRVAVA